MRDLGVEMTPKEVSMAMEACHEAEEYSVDVTEWAESVCSLLRLVRLVRLRIWMLRSSIY